jgi:hypothetical protein
VALDAILRRMTLREPLHGETARGLEERLGANGVVLRLDNGDLPYEIRKVFSGIIPANATEAGADVGHHLGGRLVRLLLHVRVRLGRSMPRSRNFLDSLVQRATRDSLDDERRHHSRAHMLRDVTV